MNGSPLKITFGYKHPLGNLGNLPDNLPIVGGESVKISLRHEFNPFDWFNYDVKAATSIGKNLELVAGTYDPDFSFASVKALLDGDLTNFGDLSFHNPTIKGDHELVKNIVFGWSANVLDGEYALRFGYGSTDKNIFVEASLDLFATFDFLIDALSSDVDENAFLPDAANIPPVVIATDAEGNKTAFYIHETTGLRVKAPVLVDSTTGALSSGNVTVLSTNSTTGTSIDLLRGNTYPPDAVDVGYEISTADEIAQNSYNAEYGMQAKQDNFRVLNRSWRERLVAREKTLPTGRKISFFLHEVQKARIQFAKCVSLTTALISALLVSGSPSYSQNPAACDLPSHLMSHLETGPFIVSTYHITRTPGTNRVIQVQWPVGIRVPLSGVPPGRTDGAERSIGFSIPYSVLPSLKGRRVDEISQFREFSLVADGAVDLYPLYSRLGLVGELRGFGDPLDSGNGYTYHSSEGFETFPDEDHGEWTRFAYPGPNRISNGYDTFFRGTPTLEGVEAILRCSRRPNGIHRYSQCILYKKQEPIFYRSVIRGEFFDYLEEIENISDRVIECMIGEL